MKKLIFFGLLAMTTLFVATAMSRPPIDDSSESAKTARLIGMVSYYGNVPFEVLGIKADNGKVYKLEIGENCTVLGEDGKKQAATESDISKLQGEKIEFIGKISERGDSPNLLNASTFTVEDFYVQKSK